MTEKQKTCAERVGNELKERLIDLRILYGESTEDEQRHFLDYQGYSPEDVAEMNEKELNAIWHEQRANYGLCFDYVAPETFNDQPEGFFRYQLSTGGPGDEFRFFVNPGFTVHRIEYWFLDWFDGANVILNGDDYELLKTIFEDFNDMGVVESEYNKAMED